MRRIFALIAFALLPYSAQAFTASDVEFSNDTIIVYDVGTVEDLVNAVPEFVTVEEIGSVSESVDSKIEVELQAGDDAVEGVIDPTTATLMLFTGPDALGCVKSYTGLSMCIAHTWWFQYCWTGGFACYFMKCGWDVLGSCY